MLIVSVGTREHTEVSDTKKTIRFFTDLFRSESIKLTHNECYFTNMNHVVRVSDF